MDYIKLALEALAKVSDLAVTILVQTKQLEADLKAKVEAMQPSLPPDKDKQ